MNYLIIGICCFYSVHSLAQEPVVPEEPQVVIYEVEKPVGEEIVEFPDVEAEFPGGIDSLRYFIATNVVYPTAALEQGIEGRVYLDFIIEKDGSISTINVLRGVNPELDNEAKRVISSMPKWIPALATGKTVRSRMRLPILFVLEKEK